MKRMIISSLVLQALLLSAHQASAAGRPMPAYAAAQERDGFIRAIDEESAAILA